MKISAVIPVYNGKKYLKEAFESIKAQTLQPIELIIVDDGSVDGSVDYALNFEAHFPIRILSKPNGGQSSARNLGITVAEGDFIALLDQDDIWYSQHLEKLAEPFKDNVDLGWVYSNLDKIDENGCVFASCILDDCNFPHPQRNIYEMIKQDMYILPSATLIRKKALIEVGMFDERLSGYEDDDLFLRLFMSGWKRKYIPENLSQWRIHPNNSGVLSPKGCRSRLIYTQKIIENIKTNMISNKPPSEIVGERFFPTLLDCYSIALGSKNYKECVRFYDDLVKYLDLCSVQIRKHWSFRIGLMKMPRLTYYLYKTRENLRRFI